MKTKILNSFITTFCLFVLLFSCQKKDVEGTKETVDGTPNNPTTTTTTGGTTTGVTTTGGTTTGGTTTGSTTGGTTTGGTTTGGSTTGGPKPKGTIVFHKPENYYNTITLYFEGSHKGDLGPSARHANPTCNQNGCIIITNLTYGDYSYEGRIYAASGDYLRSEYGSVRLDAPCVAQSVSP